MTSYGKRKWRWGSKSIFGSRAPNKVVITEHSIASHQKGSTDQRAANDTSPDGCDIEDERQRSRVKVKLRRNGSKFLSIVSLKRDSGEYMCIVYI